MPARDEPFDTVPPPAGEADAYSARTRVGELPPELMAELRAASRRSEASIVTGRSDPAELPAHDDRPKADARPTASVNAPANASDSLPVAAWPALTGKRSAPAMPAVSPSRISSRGMPAVVPPKPEAPPRTSTPSTPSTTSSPPRPTGSLPPPRVPRFAAQAERALLDATSMNEAVEPAAHEMRANVEGAATTEPNAPMVVAPASTSASPVIDVPMVNDVFLAAESAAKSAFVPEDVVVSNAPSYAPPLAAPAAPAALAHSSLEPSPATSTSSVPSDAFDEATELRAMKRSWGLVVAVVVAVLVVFSILAALMAS